jgi:hypothetical protein
MPELKEAHGGLLLSGQGVKMPPSAVTPTLSVNEMHGSITGSVLGISR